MTREQRNSREVRRLRALIERPERCTFWQPYTITPRLIEKGFGDGRLLICVTPLATRPNYFVVRIDSRTKDLREPAPVESAIRKRGGYDVSLLEDIMCAAEEEYGYFGDERDASGDETRYFPVVDWGVGCAWGKPFPIAEWTPTIIDSRSHRTEASRRKARKP